MAEVPAEGVGVMFGLFTHDGGTRKTKKDDKRHCDVMTERIRLPIRADRNEFPP